MVFDFESFNRRYAIVVVLRDSNKIGWKECQALADCMSNVSRGKNMNNENFIALGRKLKKKFGAVRGPFSEKGRLVLVVSSGQGPMKQNDSSENVIAYVSIKFDSDGDLSLEATTFAGRMYTVILSINNKRSLFYEMDCKAFVDIIYMLETADTVSPRGFLCALAVLHSRYNILHFGLDPNGFYKAQIYASNVKNNLPLNEIILSAVRDETIKSIPEPEPSNELQSPYQDITFVRKLQESGQAQVYEGKNKDSVKVAVKVFKAEKSNIYRNELRILQKMGNHPNVVQVLTFHENPQPCVVMRWIEGSGDLLQYMEKHGRLSSDSARSLAIGIAEGIKHLHLSGIVHRDLKPANIVLQKKGRTKTLVPIIIDLGLGSIITPQDAVDNREGVQEFMKTFAPVHISKKTGSVKGTLFWMAPEMILKREWSEKTDVYAFGIILWQLLSGVIPYRDAQITGPIDLILQIGSGLRPGMGKIKTADQSLQELIMQCWDHDPEKRPNIMEVIDILRGEQAEIIFNEVNKDRHGLLDFSEFTQFLKRYAKGVKPKDVYPIFNAIDENNNGYVELDEFKSFWNMVLRQGLENALEVCKRFKSAKEEAE